QGRVIPLVTIAVDCMGGDHGPHVTVPAALDFQTRVPDVAVVLVGLREPIEAELQARGAVAGARLRVHPAREVVAMDEPPVGAMLVAAVEHKERPSVGLLNIGVEDIKGNETVKRAAELLRASGLNFHGNVEGDDIYKGTTDVVVCDGFVGNSLLKASEGVAKMITGFLREEFKRNPWNMLAALMAT